MNAITLFLAQVLSIYFIIVGSSLLINGQQFKKMINEFHANDSLTIFYGAILSFALGITMVLKHNVWDGPVQIIITLIGWAALAKGITLFYLPTSWTKMTKGFNAGLLYVVGVVFLGLGGYLGYMAYFVEGLV